MTRLLAALAAASLTATACASAGAQPRETAAPAATSVSPSPTRASTPSPSVRPTRPATPSPTPRPTIATPATTGPAYVATVSRVTAADLPHSYRAGCPVGPDRLRMVHLRFWGFDGRPHSGALVVEASVATPVVRIFKRLYDARFPIRRMQPVDAYGGDDDRSMAADNTSAFNCRYAVAPGPHHWSAHAYGQAIDVNTVENPYVEGGQVRPPSGAAYVDRSNVRPGMALAGGVLVRAFAAEGWQWGGRWSGAPDYQHFSASGG